jgi:hypothetical protein
MGTETLVAHCGGCASRMVLEETTDGWWFFRCEDCGEETEPRETADEAGEDAVWDGETGERTTWLSIQFYFPVR